MLARHLELAALLLHFREHSNRIPITDRAAKVCSRCRYVHLLRRRWCAYRFLHVINEKARQRAAALATAMAPAGTTHKE